MRARFIAPLLMGISRSSVGAQFIAPESVARISLLRSAALRRKRPILLWPESVARISMLRSAALRRKRPIFLWRTLSAAR